jgi:predicted ATPase
VVVHEFSLENVKCFEKATLRFVDGDQPRRWITFLSENGGGKTTALQALALLLAGPESAQNLLPRPMAWPRDESRPGLLSVRIRQGLRDPGQFGESKVTRTFGYSFHVTGSQPITLRNRRYSEPTVVENVEKRLSWLREHAFASPGAGWFAVGYGAFRRLTRSSQIIIPALEPQARFTNFITQFNEDDPLSAFERWMVYLDYRITKARDKDAAHKKEIGVAAINQLLPENVQFSRVTDEGRVEFSIGGARVPTIALSDGYRSVLALAGDLVWRLMNAFPDSDTPLSEEGVVLIDELDIHLHPVWQRQIAGWLRQQFPNLQFVVATHSPLIAAGAGDDALTLKFDFQDGKSEVGLVPGVSALNVDRVLQSEAFGLVSPFSPQTQAKIDRYDSLARKPKKTKGEEHEYQLLLDFMQGAQPFTPAPPPDSLDARVERFLAQQLQ